MTLLAKKITKYFEREGAISDSQEELFQFAIEGVLHEALILLLCSFIGIRMGLFCENLVFLFAYCTLHRYAGEIHAETRIRCTICTCILCYICMMIVKYFPSEITMLLSIPAFWVSTQYVPNIPWTNSKTIQQVRDSHLCLKRAIYLLTAAGILSMVIHNESIYIPIFTAFGAYGMLSWITSYKNVTISRLSKGICFRTKLQLISNLVLSIGLIMVRESCFHFYYKPAVSDSLRRYADKL